MTDLNSVENKLMLGRCMYTLALYHLPYDKYESITLPVDKSKTLSRAIDGDPDAIVAVAKFITEE